MRTSNPWKTVCWAAVACLCLSLTGCPTDDSDGPGGGDAGNADTSGLDVGFDMVLTQLDTTSIDTASPDGGPFDTSVVCDDRGPDCVYGCGSDALSPAVCGSSGWECPPDTVDAETCPPGTCWGGPMSGEVCDNGWQCRPWETGALDSCPAGELLCADCGEFTSPYVNEECTCSCDAGTVTCGFSASCEAGLTAISSLALAGVTLRLSSERCSWTLAEAAEGIEIAYTLTVEEDVPDLRPAPQDAGNCDQPGETGLILFERISGGEQNYCECDSGLCMFVAFDLFTLEAGVYSGTITWTGRNWWGQSDTGNPLGDPFPAGTYTVSISAIGTQLADDVIGMLRIESTLEITLTP